MNDLDVSTQYDVDDSVYVYEEICGDPQLTTIRDYREVSGGGKKDLKQGFSSGSYAAISGVNADSGSVESSATLTSTSLSATQRSNIGGYFAQSLLAGSMGYLGGIAFTGQYVGVASGILSTVQTLSLGQSIYSTQNFQAGGKFPMAVGYALVGSGGLNGNDVQGAFIAAGACEEGSISGYMGAEVIRVPDAQYVDPVAYGSNMVARGDKAAGIIAGAGNLNEFGAQNQFANFNGLLGQGAIAGAVGIGEDSFASVDYIEARTDGHETSAFEVDAKAKGDDAAVVAAGAGSFSRKIGFGIYPTMFFYNEIFDMQGSIAGATAIGDDSKAKADFIGAITDGERTSARGSDLLAKGDGFVAVGAGAGSFYWDQRSVISPFFFYGSDDLGLQGAIAGAVAGGENSKAKADYVGAFTDGETTFAEGHKIRARGDEFAGVGAGAGSLLYLDRGLMLSPFFSGSFDSQGIEGALAGAAAGGKKSEASANFIGALTDGETTFAEGYKLRARGDEFAGVVAGAGSLYLDHGLMQSPLFSGSFDSLGIEGALAGAAAGGKKSEASANFIGALTDGETTFAEGYGMRAKGDKFAATGAGAVSIRKQEYSINPVWPYTQDTQGAIVGDIGLGEDSFASADYAGAETDGDQTSAIGIDLMARGKRSAHAIVGAGEDIYLDNGALKIEQGSATGLNALDNGEVRAALMYAGTGDITESYGERMQAMGDESALAYTASGDKLTVWADSIRVKDGTLAGLGAKGAMSQVQADELFSDRSDAISTSHVNNLIALGEGAIAATASGEKIDLMLDKAEVDTGSLTGAAANGDAMVTSANLASFKCAVSDLSTGEMLAAGGAKSAVLATGKGAKVTIKADEDEGRAKVEQGTIAGVAAYKNAWVSGYELASGDIELDIGTLVMDGEGSLATGLSGSGDKSAALASGAGEGVVIAADEDKSRAKVEQGSLVGATAFKNALVGGDLLASGQMQVAVGTQLLDGQGSAGMGLIGSGEKSSALASGAGEGVVIKANKNEGIAEVEKGTITGVTAFKNALVGGDLLASGQIQLAINPLVLDGMGSVGSGLSASGEDSASGASGYGDAVFTKASNQMGQAKVTNGGITGMAAHEGAQVGADLMGSAGIAGLSAAGWIGMNPSATGTLSALGTGFGSEVNVEADAAIVETTAGSIIGITASGANSMTSAESIGGYETALVPTLAATNVLAQGDSASAASATGLSAAIESDKISVTAGSVVGMATAGGMVEADSLGTSTLLPSGTNLKASGTTASAASATSAFSTATIESNKVSVNGGSVVGMAAEGTEAQVGAQSLGFGVLGPSGSTLEATGTGSTIGVSYGDSVNLQSSGITTVKGSLVGASASNSGGGAKVCGSSLSIGLSGINILSTGAGLRAETADQAIIAAVAGSSATLGATSAGMTAGTLIGVGAITLGAGDDLHADSLSASYLAGVSSSGSGLFSRAGTSALLGIAGDGRFNPSAANGFVGGSKYADAGSKTTTLGNSVSVSSSDSLTSSYVSALGVTSRTVTGKITASGLSGSYVFAGYTGDPTKASTTSQGTRNVNAFYTSNLVKGASV